MKFNLQTSIDWCKIMKITLSQVVVALVLTGVSYAGTGKAQAILDRTVDVSMKNSRLRTVLHELGRNANVKFVYSETLIRTDQEVSVKARKEKLKVILEKLLNPMGISYTVVEDHIVLNKVNITNESGPGKAEAMESEGFIEEKAPVTLSGKVTSVKGEPLPGVSVRLKGTQLGASTDANGGYTIVLPDGNGTLVFSYVGFILQEVAVNNRKIINVTLIEDTQSLKEVVVVAFGTQRKETLTGSVAKVSSKELNTAIQSNMVNMLTGKLPGLRVIQRTSEPGTYNTSFDIRGFGSPLVIIDGVPRGDFNRLNPSDIESISILKDASAAVYGARSANGVILVTTKKGKAGKVELNYNGSYGLATITNSPDNMSSYEWATISNESYYNDQYQSTVTRVRNAPPHSEAKLQQFAEGTLPNTSWINVGMNQNAPVYKQDISASGGTDKISYYTSLGYLREDGLFKTGDLFYNRYNFRSNVTAQISKNLEARMLIGGLLDKRQQPGPTNSDDIIKGLWQNRPDIPVYANDNPLYFSKLDDATHPLARSDADYAGYTINQFKSFQGSFALNYNVPFLAGLKAATMFSYDYKNRFDKVWRKKFNLYEYNSATDTYTPTTYNSPSQLNSTFAEESVAQIQASLNYEKTILGDHHIKALALFEQIQNNNDINTLNGSKQFSIDAVDELYAGDANVQTVNSSTSSTYYPYATQNFVGRLNYEYKSKYFVEGSFSYMGSSRFAPGHRWGFFPGIQGGWRMSEESFIKDNIPFLDNLKLRASWGILGDDSGANVQWIDGYTYPGGARYISGGNIITGLGFRALPYIDLSWFESRTTNLGVDADLWKGLLHLEFDVFRREREGLFAQRNLSIPGTVGASLPQENLNSDLTKGLEVVLGHANTLRGFRYNITVNASVARTKNLYIERAESGSSYANWKTNYSNRWNDILFGYKVIGQFQNQEEINNAPIHDGEGNKRLLPGDFRYEDFNNDGVIDDNDLQPIARSVNPSSTNYVNTPNISYGFNIDLQWKGFDLNALFQGASKLYVRYAEQLAAPLFFGRNGLSYFMDRWHREDPSDVNSPWIPGTYPSTRPHGQLGSNYRQSDFWIKDASYLRLRSMELGYTLPARWLNNRGIKALRVYANGYNLFTWSKVDFIDPEHTPSNVGMQYPITRNYTFGVNLTF